MVQREVVLLLVLAVAAIGAFLLTRTAAHWDRDASLRDAAAWYALGEAQLRDGRVAEAIPSLRRATTRDRGRRQYVLTLGRALAAASQVDDARRVLLELRESAPEDPVINIELARLAASRQDVSEALRYYRSALYGVWADPQKNAREQLRIELIRFLLRHDQRSNALAELLALSSNVADTAPAYIEIGQLFLEAGDAQRALGQFARALGLEPRNGDALAGAGEAAFDLTDYTGARRYLRQMPELPARLAELRDVATLVLASDPLAPRLTLTERRRRLTAVFRQAVHRLDECSARTEEAGAAGSGALEALRAEAQAFETNLKPRVLRDSPEVIEGGVDLAYRIEQAAARSCGEPSGLDRALLLIGQRQGAQ